MVLELSLRVVYRGVLHRGGGPGRGGEYFLALAAFDLLLFLFYLPILVSACGCTFPNYGSAYYFTHFGWSLANSFHGMGTYTLVLLALDRFVGVCSPPRSRGCSGRPSPSPTGWWRWWC
ncbi:hypothetical protein GWK47_007926 [Chionoecetes opilio]|uniref:G-protein coupled receptors family 1 profile domain-containing protein n=1 Tax=Chionoecetes opilio TaxID=41210 RepID=A0A8J4Y0G5_CHIOP|nr:hypothetical protein GWK47_007926 [Chionoecetes opilio]